jgi:hypothetical protein
MSKQQKRVRENNDNVEAERGHHHYPRGNTKTKTWHDGGTMDAKGHFSMAFLKTTQQVS